ncbi:MAG: NAD(P)-binding domain-containing protein [Acidobacteriota bacterium]
MPTLSRYRFIIVGAGPAGISLAVEACVAGISSEEILLLEKGAEHSWAIRKFYPESKPVTANYKGIEAQCEGVMCIVDTTKEHTLSYLDQAIDDYSLQVHYNEAVHRIAPYQNGELGFTVETNNSIYQSRFCAIAIGILGRPNKPTYALPNSLRRAIHFDITSERIEDKNCLVVGGGDTASEYCQFLVQQNNRVTLSYRGSEFTRLNSVNYKSLMALQSCGEVKILAGSNIVSIADVDGRPQVTFAEPEYSSIIFDKVIYALGGSTPENFLRSVGIEFDGSAPILKEGYETSVSGLFLIGDLSAGKSGGSIISAFNSSARAMRYICTQYLTKKDTP